jgi:Mg-chelatase subunit ChlD
MITRQKIVTFGIPTAAAATIALAAGLTPWSRDAVAPSSMSTSPSEVTIQSQIDVVFAVDTTGSMGGLIEGAKRTVWSIANHIRSTEANADLRIGLVAYRDIGDEYVTRPFSLTTDLDAVFVELSSYRAEGGGDMPENVDAALDVALHQMQWRDGAKKLVFLVGDAPPASRGDVPTFDVLAREAANRKITINTIRAGHDSETAIAFQKIASLAGGEFSSIQQDGGVQQIATPYDERIAELSAKIDRSVVVTGDAGVRQAYRAKLAAAEAAPAATKADRAAYYARSGSGRAADDLVASFASGDMDISHLEADALPEELRGKGKAELAAELERRAAERKAAEAEIAELAKKRAEFLKEQAEKGDPAGFDVEVKKTLEKQLKK